MHKLNQVLTTSKNLICSSMKKKANLLYKKIRKIPLPSANSATMNIEFTAAWRGRGWGIIEAGQRH